MIGRDDSLQGLGIIPCAITWLFKLINERKEKTGARFSVRVSAVEVCATLTLRLMQPCHVAADKTEIQLGCVTDKLGNVLVFVRVQVWGKEENLKDLLSDVATGSLQDGQSPGVYLCEDPICGMQVTHSQACLLTSCRVVFLACRSSF